MGIDISTTKVVSYTNVHQQMINCDPATNPRKIKIKALDIHYAFRRVRHRSSSGDGNPFMYALKNINGYSITTAEKNKFCPDFQEIVQKLQHQLTNHTIVAMPSSSPIASDIALCVQNVIPQMTIIGNLFQKKTCAEVHADLILQNLQFTGDELSQYNQLLSNLKKNHNLNISLKKVSMIFREYIVPIKLTGVPVPDRPILLVDDLLATGSTLLSARDALIGINPNLSIQAFCLLGKL